MSRAQAAKAPQERPFPPQYFSVPLDLVRALPTSSIMPELIQARRDKGDTPLPIATVFALGGKYFALVHFAGDGRPSLQIPLDVWEWEFG